jgi:hypothetical protein
VADGPGDSGHLALSSAAVLILLSAAGQADRNSARRTTVVDDQADFFEIDGNAWLSDEVGAGCTLSCCRHLCISAYQLVRCYERCSPDAETTEGRLLGG